MSSLPQSQPTPKPQPSAKVTRYRGGSRIDVPIYVPAFTQAVKMEIPVRARLYCGTWWLFVAPHDLKAIRLARRYIRNVEVAITDERFELPKQPSGVVRLSDLAPVER